jgi:hypothetical protein
MRIGMTLSRSQISKLTTLVRLAQELLAEVESAPSPPTKSKKAGSDKATRRSGKELVAFRKMLKAERKKGVPVSELAKKHGISTAYIYQLG